MVVYQGWEVTIEMPHFVQKKEIGDGTTTSWSYPDCTPIVDINGDEMVDTNDVKVYVNDEEVEVASVEPETGTITLVEAPPADSEVRIKFAYGPEKVARSQSVSIESSKDREEIPILGQTQPFIKTGRQSITGSLEALITGREFFEAAGADQSFTPKFKMTLNVGTPPAKIELYGVTIGTLGMEGPRDDLATQSIDFGAERIKWLDPTS